MAIGKFINKKIAAAIIRGDPDIQIPNQAMINKTSKRIFKLIKHFDASVSVYQCADGRFVIMYKIGVKPIQEEIINVSNRGRKAGGVGKHDKKVQN